ncbi:MAG: hypothetical protein OXF32_05955 [Anaerolineaceae bacterium]|nr:hypothetical protein [Anaerolineaceae bacterium]
MKRALLPLWPVGLGLLACFLPWMESAGNTLTLNLWDLAEWCSINPLSRHANIPLGASLGLRSLPLFLLALAIWRDAMPTPLRMTLTLLTAIAVLPPPEFLLGDAGDPNHRQQLALGFVALLCGFACRFPFVRRPLILRGTGLIAMAVAWLSLSAALALQKGLGLETHPGPGFLLFMFAMLWLEVFGLQNIRATRHESPWRFLVGS